MPTAPRYDMLLGALTYSLDWRGLYGMQDVSTRRAVAGPMDIEMSRVP